MKKILFTFFTVIGLTLSAQQEAPPQGINYQAVVYSDNGNNQPGLNNPGQVLWNKDITLRFAVYQGEDNPILVYEELHAITTDEFGMVSLVIGQGVPQGTQLFETINWGGGSHFLRVDVDKNAGVNFAPMSYQKLWSVPYALYSEQSNSSNYSDSSDYSNIAGNGITGVTDNGDGTLTFTYFDGSSYTTPVLSGMEGPQGEIGPEGPAGIDGQDGLSAYEVWISQGNTGTEQDFLNGVIGPQGPAGNDGVNGIDGTDGQNGQDGLSAYETWLSQGNTGTEADFLTGIIGSQGPSGADGLDGAIGPQGPAGADGLDGATGPQGPAGADGLDGVTGPQGPAGADGLDGATGPQGPAGADGLDGATGPQGPAGIDGLDGTTGPQGPAGADGLDGSTGPQGLPGTDGVDGESAYEIWLSLGNTGTEQDFIDALSGSSTHNSGCFIASSGDWIVPIGVKTVEILMSGGGGGGGDFGGNSCGGGAGGAGGIIQAIIPVNSGDVCTIVIGQGGTRGTCDGCAGANGGNTSFAINGQTVFTAIGGNGGTNTQGGGGGVIIDPNYIAIGIGGQSGESPDGSACSPERGGPGINLYEYRVNSSSNGAYPNINTYSTGSGGNGAGSGNGSGTNGSAGGIKIKYW